MRYFRGCSCCKLSGAFVLRFLLVLMIDTVPSSFARPPSKPPVTTGSPHGHGHNRVTVCCIGCLFVFVAPAPLSLFSCMLSHFTSTRRPIRQPDCCNLCVIFYFQFAFSAAVAAARGPGINCIWQLAIGLSDRLIGSRCPGTGTRTRHLPALASPIDIPIPTSRGNQTWGKWDCQPIHLKVRNNLL